MSLDDFIEMIPDKTKSDLNDENNKLSNIYESNMSCTDEVEFKIIKDDQISHNNPE